MKLGISDIRIKISYPVGERRVVNLMILGLKSGDGIYVKFSALKTITIMSEDGERKWNDYMGWFLQQGIYIK